MRAGALIIIGSLRCLPAGCSLSRCPPANMSFGLLPPSPPPPSPPPLLPPPPRTPVQPASAIPEPLVPQRSAIQLPMILGIVAGALMLVSVAVLAYWFIRRRRRSGSSHELSSVTEYRNALDSRPALARRNSSAVRNISPLDQAIAFGEPLRVRASHPDALIAGSYVRAVGGTRGQPKVQLLGVGMRVVVFNVPKKHLRRANLAVPEAEAAGREQGERYMRAYPEATARETQFV